MPCAYGIKSNGGLKRGNVESCPLITKISYLPYHSAYGHETCQGDDLECGINNQKTT